MVDIKSKLKNKKVILSYFDKNDYSKSLFKLIKSLQGKKVCFVTLNKCSSDLSKALSVMKFSEERIFFIDAVSQGLKKKCTKNNTLYISSPAALTELSLAIKSAMNTKAFDVLIFDSLSTLNIFDLKNKSAERFTIDIISKIKSSNMLGIFTCMREDSNTPLVKAVCLNVDDTINGKQTKKESMLKTAYILPSIAALYLFSLLIGNGQITGQVVKTSTEMTSLSNITGYSIVSTGSPEMTIGSIIALALVLIGIIFAYMGVSVAVVSSAKLLKIKPKKIEVNKVKKKYTKIVQNWIRQMGNS